MSRVGGGRQALSAAALSALLFCLLATSAWAISDFDGDGSLPPQDCDNLDPAVAPGKPDRPDLVFEDTNCDGIDGDVAKAVFVSLGGDDAATGSKENPLRTIAAAIQRAKAGGKDVYVTGGTYSGTVELESGVGLYGGYAPVTGVRSATEVTRISATGEAVLTDGDTGVILQQLTLVATPSGAAGSSAYGLRAINGSSVSLARVTTEPGAGRTGALGDPGRTSPTPQNAHGTDGLSPCDTGQLLGTDGGFGAAAGSLNEFGGGGGLGSTSTAVPGDDGEDAPGKPDSGGDGMLEDGEPGTDGDDGAPGGDGSGGLFGLAAAGSGWAAPAADGDSGHTGGRGTGGGGGGGGGGTLKVVTFPDPIPPLFLTLAGGGGGGGGAAGPPGGGGRGGGAGGGSFGVYVHDSTVVATDSALNAGDGGNGGHGGKGAPGSGGGIGGQGGTGACSRLFDTSPVGLDVVLHTGGRGGTGGTGGTGGDGGGGAGGPSAAAFTTGPDAHFTARDSTLQEGSGGVGGRRGLTGQRAEAGQAAATLAAPSAGSDPGDFDGDGSSDADDACPDEAATAGDADGCPDRPARLADSDGDAIPNGNDVCPTAHRGATDLDENGCADAPPLRLPLPPPPPPPPPPSPGPGGIDGDADGFFAGQDCNDGDPNIRPGAQEIVGNDTDENCDGRATPFPRITVTLSHGFKAFTRFTRLTRLQIKNVPAGSTVRVTCKVTTKKARKGKRTKRCRGKARKPFRKRNASGTVNLNKRYKRVKLRVGTTITVRVTLAGNVGAVKVLKIRRRKEPKTTTRCLPPGARRPVRC